MDKAFMEKCDELIVLELEGWQESAGVQREIDFFRQKGAKVWMFSEFEKEFL
nr:DUF1937 family protein [Photobacterium sp. GJ3]